MNKPQHAFDPDLLRHYTRSSSDIPLVEGRWLFYQLNQSIIDKNILSSAYCFVNQGLKEVEQVYSSIRIQDYSIENLRSLKVSNIPALSESLLSTDNLHKCIEQSASIPLTQPSWLQNISQVCCSQTKTAVQLFAIYLQLTQKGKYCSLYESLLLAEGFKIPVLYSYSYSQQFELMPEVFDFSAIQLALRQFPRVFFAEILGFTLAYIQMPVLIEVCFPKHQLPASLFEQRKQILQAQLIPLTECINDYLRLFPQQQQALWQKVQQGFWLYQLPMQRCRNQFNQVLAIQLSPQQAVTKLFQQKVSSAFGHHHKIYLQNISLEQWLAGMPENSEKFLDALKQSNYVDRKNPLNSRLLTLFDVKGPMFGVFNQAERLVIQNWLIDNRKNQFIAGTVKVTASRIIQQRPYDKQEQKRGYQKLTTRELYYYFVNADLFPDVHPVAQEKVEKRLKYCTLFNPLPFKHYSHQQFDAYIAGIYQTEVSAYHALQGKPKISRAAYIWGIEQIAPMILIDGCWLQNSQILQHTNPEISEILFSIYCDEIGNGQLQHNHCYIFQELLDSLSIDVPPVYCTAFIKHSKFINSAFDLPSYMLALSLHSERFLPELLGLNMAIELSGLGKSYMQLIDDWNYWGIDSTIANIHISIDNFVSGHTFLAKKAIQLYLDNILKQSGDTKVRDRHWRRIYTGYASLRFVGERFKLGLPVHYMMHKLT